MADTQPLQVFSNLIARHEGKFYRFVHAIHKQGGAGVGSNGQPDNVMGELVGWAEDIVAFLRDGLGREVDVRAVLEELVPPKRWGDLEEDVEVLAKRTRERRARRRERLRGKVAAISDSASAEEEVGEGEILDEIVDEDEEEEDEDGDGEIDVGKKKVLGGDEHVVSQVALERELKIVPELTRGFVERVFVEKVSAGKV